MDGVRADIDGIRAAAALAQRQGEHMGEAEEYLHQSCTASAAFQGVLGFFAGTYSSAVSNAVEGIRGTRSTHQRVAENLVACAGSYEAADRAAYDGFARVAGQEHWGIGAYVPTGSGRADVAPGSCVPAPGSKPVEAGGGSSVLDDLRAKAESEAIARAKGLPGDLTRDTMAVDGKRVFKDEVAEGVKADSTRISRANDFLDRVQDPTGLKGALGEANKEALKEAVKDVDVRGHLDSNRLMRQGYEDAEVAPAFLGPDSIAGSPGHSNEQSANLHHNVRSVAGWYDQGMGAKKFAEGMLDDPTGGVRDSLAETGDAIGRVRKYQEISEGGGRNSTLSWGSG